MVDFIHTGVGLFLRINLTPGGEPLDPHGEGGCTPGVRIMFRNKLPPFHTTFVSKHNFDPWVLQGGGGGCERGCKGEE